jgi:uncharacterized protein YecE (DUF72 family)
MWGHRPWVGRWFPTRTRQGDELAAYATWCTAVEGNTTFYALPDEATVHRWADLAPDGFRFVCKLPRTITHDRRLRHVEEETMEAVARLRGLGDRLGPVSIQLPASFRPEDVGALAAFLTRAPGDVHWCVEVRHPLFFADGGDRRRLLDLLHGHGADLVHIDSRALFDGPCETPGEIDAFGRKPRLPVRPVALGTHPVVRFIGQTDPDANPPYWARWVDKVVQWLDEGRRPYVFLHTPDNVWSPHLARRFHDEVRSRRPDLAPLPEPLTADDEQPDLFGL